MMRACGWTGEWKWLWKGRSWVVDFLNILPWVGGFEVLDSQILDVVSLI